MSDTELIDWLADNCIIEGIALVEDDIFERACALAGDSEPDTTEEWKPWYRQALREIIAEAMLAKTSH